MRLAVLFCSVLAWLAPALAWDRSIAYGPDQDFEWTKTPGKCHIVCIVACCMVLTHYFFKYVPVSVYLVFLCFHHLRLIELYNHMTPLPILTGMYKFIHLIKMILGRIIIDLA